MVLNKDCIRDILIYIEEKCVYYDDKRFGHMLHEVTFNEICKAEELSQYSKDDKYYTVQKLFEGHFIKGYVIPKDCYDKFNYANITALSLRGHDLLDNIKPETVWNQTKSVLHKVGSFSLSIMAQVAGEIMAVYTKAMMNSN